MIAAGQVWEIRDCLGILPDRIVLLLKRHDTIIAFYECFDLLECQRMQILETTFMGSSATQLS